MDAGAALAAVLEEEHACCAELDELLRAERAAVAAHDLDGLLDTLKRRECLQARWERAAEARARLVREAGVPLGELAARDPELARLVRRLREAGFALQRAQRRNAALLEGALATVTGLVAALRRAEPGSRYDGRASMTAPRQARAAGWSA